MKRTKWTKDKIAKRLQEIKSKDGKVYTTYLYKHYSDVNAAAIRYFESYDAALIYAGFDPAKERGVINNHGKSNPMYGRNHSKQAKEKMSQKLKERHRLNPDYQTGPNNPMYGKKQSEESNAKRSAALLKYHSQFEKRPYNLTEDGRKRMQRAAAKRMASQKKEGTDIEIIISNLLDSMSIKYISQYAFEFFCVDFYIPNNNAVIWCDGDYWHANPAKYKTATKRQATQRRLDSSHSSYLRNRNIEYLRLWGEDIKNRKEWCEQQIRKMIGVENDRSE